MGLGLNSMEGREAKHVFIAKYSKNTLHQHRWQQIFRHEYVTLIWLCSRGLNLSTTDNNKATYIPKKVLTDNTFCYCGLPKPASMNKCNFCSHSFRQEIESSVLQSKNKLSFKCKGKVMTQNQPVPSFVYQCIRYIITGIYWYCIMANGLQSYVTVMNAQIHFSSLHQVSIWLSALII